MVRGSIPSSPWIVIGQAWILQGKYRDRQRIHAFRWARCRIQRPPSTDFCARTNAVDGGRWNVELCVILGRVSHTQRRRHTVSTGPRSAGDDISCRVCMCRSIRCEYREIGPVTTFFHLGPDTSVAAVTQARKLGVLRAAYCSPSSMEGKVR